MQWESSHVIYFTPVRMGAVQNVTAKNKSHTKLARFHIFAERSIKMLTLCRKSKLKHLLQARLHPNKASLEFNLCYCTQARRCFNIISCKGQEMKPKATLSSFSFAAGLFAVDGCCYTGCWGRKLPQNHANFHRLKSHQEASCSPKEGQCFTRPLPRQVR